MFSKYIIVFLLSLCSVQCSDITINIIDADGEIKSSRSLGSYCNPSECDQLCFRLGFSAGACLGDNCTCSIFTPKKAAVTDGGTYGAAKLSHTLGSCNPLECDQLCRRMSFTGGMCVGDNCSCRNFKPNKDLISQINSSRSLGSCNPSECDQLCRRLGFTGGLCVEDKCTCGNFKSNEAYEEIKSSHALGFCNPSACDQHCRRLDFTGGTCIQQKCTCENVKPNKDSSLFEPIESCNFGACDQLCRRLGFPGGACVGDRCKCDNFKQMTYIKDLFKRTGTCDPILCSLSCIRVKQHGGKCMKNHCICYNQIKTDEGIETRAESDIGEKDEEHDVILREEPNVTVPKNCDTLRCDDMCHRLNYRGGTCDGENCQCI